MLSRRSARSLKAFLDEVSEVMQFHVRKLYTAEGRRVRTVFIFNVWSLFKVGFVVRKTTTPFVVLTPDTVSRLTACKAC